MNPAFLSPSSIKVANEVLRWAEEFLVPENKELHRPHGSQSVCPFVNASIKHDCFYMILQPEINADQCDEKAIEQILMGYIPTFAKFTPSELKLKLTSTLLVIFPNLPEGETYILDRVHANIKDKFVKAGLMIGQFHQNCDVPSVYNPDFMVSRSPIPLMAIRYMAIHDILFLAERPDWFQIYQAQYGQRFNNADAIENYNKHLFEYYLGAKETSCPHRSALPTT